MGGFCFAPEGERLAVAHYGGLTVHDLTAPTTAPLNLRSGGSHLEVTWSPDGHFLLSALQEPAMSGWRLGDGSAFSMRGFATKVKSWAWVAEGRWLATSGSDCLPCWDFTGRNGPMGQEPVVMAQREGELVTAVAADPKRPLIAAGYDDGMVVITEVRSNRAGIIKRAGGGAVTGLAWSLDGRWLALGTEEGLAGLVPIPAS